MSTAENPLSPGFNLLADLIGSFAFPNPDDDTEPHAPGAPHLQPAALAEIRRVTISLLAWAQLLAEQGGVAQPVAAATMQHALSASKPAQAPAQPGKKKSDPDGDSTPDGGGPEPDRTKPVEPPAVAMAIISPPVKRFVCDFQGEGAIALPVPSASSANPWNLSIRSERLRTLGLLTAGGQFQFAAEATRLGELRALFQWGARELIERGLRRLGHDSTALLRAAI